MFDESTSAVDIKTEAIIYQLMNDLHIWFITISHRLSLIQYHQKQLKLSSRNTDNNENDLDLNNDVYITTNLPKNQNLTSVKIDENIVDETELVNLSTTNNITGYIEIIKSGNLLKEIKDIWKLIHLPFGPNDKILRIQVFKFSKANRYSNSFFFIVIDLYNMVHLFDNSRMLYIYLLSFNCSNWCYF
jgi:hypothetical protein